MGRKAKVSNEWFFETCDRIYAETGEVPTYEMLLELAGGGGKELVHERLCEWKATRLPKATLPAELPETLAGAMKTAIGTAEARGRLEVEPELTRLSQEAKVLAHELDLSEEKCESLEEENKRLASECASLASEVAREEVEIKRLDRENQMLRQSDESKLLKIAKEQNRADMKEDESKRLQDELERARQSSEQLREKLAKAESTSEAQAARLKETDAEISSLRKSCEEKTQALADIKEAGARTAERLSNVEKDNVRLTAENQKIHEIADAERRRADDSQEEAKAKAIEAAKAKAELTVATGAERNGKKAADPELIAGPSPSGDGRQDVAEEGPKAATVKGQRGRRNKGQHHQ